MNKNAGEMVASPVGQKRLDVSGAAVGAARMDPSEAYGAVTELLKKYIEGGSEDAWQEIKRRIDNIYITVSSALESLEAEEPFSGRIKAQVDSGKKLFIKPNLVSPDTIDPVTHMPGTVGACTPWEFVAAVMRWFHDSLDISYHEMAVGDGGTSTNMVAFTASRLFGTTVTTQALLEGKCGDNYGGWGFYFARKYLAECHDSGHDDDPMRGYEDSIAGACIPYGTVTDKLFLYDTNLIADDGSNGREIPVSDGVNFKTITAHKAIVGGDPADERDIAAWPGCVIINVCKLKIHVTELFTCALKNLGMGLYPSHASAGKEAGKYEWKYAIPDLKTPVFKLVVPHSRWVLKTDPDTTLPLRDEDGNPYWEKTGGMEATVADALKAIEGQGIMTFHIADAIELTNINHAGPGGVSVPEGYVFVASDPVALDTCGARYLFSMVPMDGVMQIQQEYNLSSDVIQKTMMPRIEGNDIVTGEGYDSCFSRYDGLRHCEDRGLGRQEFHVVGKDLRQGGILASLEHKLGRVESGVFTQLLTDTLYHAAFKPLYDFQRACFAYLEANDKLTGSDYKRQVLEAFDENGDGVLEYQEGGKGGGHAALAYGGALIMQDIDPGRALKLRFLLSSSGLKLQHREWNKEGFDLGGAMAFRQALPLAITMSRGPEERPDPVFPGMTWGRGRWPSMQYVMQQQLFGQIYGQMFPVRFDAVMSLYGQALNYADMKWNGLRYFTPDAVSANENIIGRYHRDLADGAEPLPFTLYVPRGLGGNGGGPVPNVEETDDPSLIFTADFNGEEYWRELHLSEYGLE